MKARTTMSAFILSVIISLLVLTDAKEIGHARIKKSTDGLDKKITAIQEGLSTMIVALEEVKNLTANFAENCKEDRPCSDGWSEFESSCYRLVEGKMSWDDAMTNCKGLGGYLAEVESKEENIFINNLFTIPEAYTWIGGNDREFEGQWYWGHSKRPLGYTNWNKNEPNGGNRENCIHYINHGKWNDAPCNLRYVSICEMPI